ncbi:hypothetical protein BCD48_38260 [Pseudofrankia sp. BMG5.36]|nr:hypothetical protein BCD48_38260 [Pseudofrankia sp. BMG5.36]
MRVGDSPDGGADGARYLSPDTLRELLAEAGLDPDNLGQMLGVAAAGITVEWWRNTKVEDWHAGSDGALSDVDMYRINTHTTAKVRDRLRAWCRQQSIRTMVDVAAADPGPLEHLLFRLYRWMINPKRVLVTGATLYSVVATTLANARADPDCDVPDDVTPASELAAYEEQVRQAAGSVLLSMDEHDPRLVFYVPALFSTLSATGWWGTAGYPAHVAAVFAALDNPNHPIWLGGGRYRHPQPERT